MCPPPPPGFQVTYSMDNDKARFNTELSSPMLRSAGSRARPHSSIACSSCSQVYYSEPSSSTITTATNSAPHSCTLHISSTSDVSLPIQSVTSAEENFNSV
ncbi:unnamed protein product, partial [Protopolystoma xenopodis]